MGEIGKDRNERVKERREFLRAEFFNACADNGLQELCFGKPEGRSQCPACQMWPFVE